MLTRRLFLVGTLALAGCGVKGPLEPPKADTTAPAAQSSAAPATAASPSASAFVKTKVKDSFKGKNGRTNEEMSAATRRIAPPRSTLNVWQSTNTTNRSAEHRSATFLKAMDVAMSTSTPAVSS